MVITLPSNAARVLRENSTVAERRLWLQLRNRNMEAWKFRRQAPIGPYIVDFVCFQQKLAIEVDGGHHQSQAEDDKIRTDWLESQGFKVLRFWNNEVLTNMDGVLASILEYLEHPHLSPLPSRERKNAPFPSKGEGRDEGEGPSPQDISTKSSNLQEDPN